MLKEQLSNYNLILASGSPRRHQFFKDLELDFEVRLKTIDEVFPEHLQKDEITDYLAKLKATAFISELSKVDILVTSDTIVWHNNKALNKPENEQEAFQMIKSLSNDDHEVITSICVTTTEKQIIRHTNTSVTFTDLTDEEIWYYIKNYKPFDKAGAYGIQEWIGAIGITNIKGSYNNVVGLPTHLLYETLKDFTSAV